MAQKSCSNPATQIRHEVYFSGRVQDVGFRQTCFEQAMRYSVVGWVRNLPNGEVHMIAEGSAMVLANFVQAIQTTTFGHVQDKQWTESAATHEFQTFTIR